MIVYSAFDRRAENSVLLTTPTNFILMQNLTACHLMNKVISKRPALPFLYEFCDTVFFSVHAPFLAFGLHGDCELLQGSQSQSPHSSVHLVSLPHV